MNTAPIKAYAPKARRDFIKAVTERAGFFGIHGDDSITPVEYKGDLAFIEGRAFSKKEGELRDKLAGRVKQEGFDAVIRSAAYTWFNRFVAIRYMELHGYLEHGYRVLSHPGGSPIPEILEHAADVELPGLSKETVIELRLAGNKDNELYRCLIVAQVNALHAAMPFLFERVDSESELLLPDNLIHTGSPVHNLVTDLPEDLWNDVEIIGWIYQFYISEKKDEVMGKVVKSEDIPFATQLFTPNWIVKYMVQNTLGRMWMATYPESLLKNAMEYYIEPAEQEPEVTEQLATITPKELDPETITFLDPACGSGHILVEAYDLFKEIYLERGYRTRDIPRLILEKNLYGLDIDDRAAQLACFAVMMKARQDDRRLLAREDLRLNIMAICDTKGLEQEAVAEIVAKKPGGKELKNTVIQLLDLFKDGKIFGSLITVPAELAERLDEMQKVVESDETGSEELFEYLNKAQLERLKPIITQAQWLARKYDCVVANPPYMGGKAMNVDLKEYAKKNYPDSKSDLFAIFVERIMGMVIPKRYIGLMTPFTWMFLSSYEKLREKIINQKTLSSLIRPEYHAFFESAYVPICTFTMISEQLQKFNGTFIDLSKFYGADMQAPKVVEAINNNDCDWCFRAKGSDLKKIPGYPIAYWASKKVIDNFDKFSDLSEVGLVRQGASTSNNSKFLRLWHEVNNYKIGYKICDIEQANISGFKWFPYNKGGEFRKWHGNMDFIINYENDGLELKEFQSTLNQGWTARLKSRDYYFKSSVSWTKISSSLFSARYYQEGFIFDVAGCCFFPYDKSEYKTIISYLNSVVSKTFLGFLSPTLNFEIEQVKKLPYTIIANKDYLDLNDIFMISQFDWDNYENSWDFSCIPIIKPEIFQTTLKKSYQKLREHLETLTQKMQRLEEENNRIFIDAYGLQDELTSDVPLSEITLTCNPQYRYGAGKTQEEYDALQLTDTMKELISYAVGCMMGRYSLDEPGLIYAHSGNEGFDSSRYTRFPADDDGIVPVMDQSWFDDDATGRFSEFLSAAWSPDTLGENLAFVAECLKPKAGEEPLDAVRRYFSTVFFKDHLKTYKKRPIYWLFSSGKHKAFECLVYLHRYNENTLSRMRSLYVTPLQGHFSAKLEYMKNEVDSATTASAQNKIRKEMDLLKKKQVELSAFDDELRHYADMKISLNLDDGVKVNYGKFGNLLSEKTTVTGKD